MACFLLQSFYNSINLQDIQKLRATFTPIFQEDQVYQRDGNQFRNGPTDGHVNKVINQNVMRDALDRHLWENLHSSDYECISILPPKRANLNRPGYFDVTFAKSDFLKNKIMAKITDVVISARLSTHTFDPEVQQTLLSWLLLLLF